MIKDGIEYPEGIDWERVKIFQKEQLVTAKRVAAICEENGIRYFLDCGTLLGAIRHGGFIPWDDDIDFALPRPDYNKLLSILSKNSDFIVLDWLTTEDYRYSFAKVMRVGVDKERMFNPSAIDVFPMDGVPRCKWLRRLQYKIRLILGYVIINRKNKLRGLRHYLCNILGLFVPKSEMAVKRLIEQLTLNSSKWTTDSFIGVRYQLSGEKYFVPFSVYDNGSIRKVKFEDTEFRIPVEVEKFLAQFFGDWHSSPPVEKRKPGHVHDSVWFYSKMDILYK